MITELVRIKDLETNRDGIMRAGNLLKNGEVVNKVTGACPKAQILALLK